MTDRLLRFHNSMDMNEDRLNEGWSVVEDSMVMDTSFKVSYDSLIFVIRVELPFLRPGLSYGAM